MQIRLNFSPSITQIMYTISLGVLTDLGLCGYVRSAQHREAICGDCLKTDRTLEYISR